MVQVTGVLSQQVQCYQLHNRGFDHGMILAFTLILMANDQQFFSLHYRRPGIYDPPSCKWLGAVIYGSTQSMSRKACTSQE
jgi:hypothetical protein